MHLKDETVLRTLEQARRLGASRQTIWRLVKQDPTYPKQREFRPGLVGCLQSEFESWLTSRPVLTAPRRRGVKKASA